MAPVTGPPDELTDPQRRALRIEIVIVLAVTFGLSAYTAILNLIEAVLLGLGGQTVALNPRLSPFDLIDLGLNLAGVFQLIAWGALACTCCGAADSAPPGSGWAGRMATDCSAASGWPRSSGCPAWLCTSPRVRWA